MVRRVAPPKRSAHERIADFREIELLLDERTVREQASRCLHCPEPMCRTGCPLANRIPEWLALAAEGKFLEASALSNLTSNMPEICSRVCPQEKLCEGACILNARSDPVAIGAVEKFINEYALARGEIHGQTVQRNGRRVAVVGSGPGGLACADELAKLGYSVTVFESQGVPGGLLMTGIPSFKLESAVVERRLDVLRQRGIVFRLGITIGRELSLGELRKRHDAIFLAIGAQVPKVPEVPGVGLKGVADALPFLAQTKVGALAKVPPIDVTGKRVAVLGGGDTAMDCLRSAIRRGAREAVCLYRRDLANMPGSRKEYYHALEEGARFHFLTNPIAIEGNANDEVTQVRCVRMELGEPDASGRRKPKTVPGSEFVTPADLALIAYGFDPPPTPSVTPLLKIATNDWGGVIVNADQTTSVPGIFAGGDLVRGPSLVVHAVRDGRNAAAGIDRYLSGQKGETLAEHSPALHQHVSAA
ncbi:MAG: NAD(P)-dependent oxidoreductase [Verrucomicrobia bacterium]|nr:NAD(P)-dependent oxidoreductase [Verrucomicrobiota bacterium]